MKRFLCDVRVSPGDTAKAKSILKGSAGANTIAAFAGWYHASSADSGTEFVRHFVIESSNPATGRLSVSITVDGVLASPMYTTDAQAAQAMATLATLMSGALSQGGVTGTVTYASQDHNANYSTMDPITDAVTRIPETLKDLRQNAQIRWGEILQFASQGAMQALIVTAVGAILFLSVAKVVTD